MAVHMSTSRSMSGALYTVGDFRKLFEGVDDSTPVSITRTPGDRPWESESFSFSITPKDAR